MHKNRYIIYWTNYIQKEVPFNTIQAVVVRVQSEVMVQPYRALKVPAIIGLNFFDMQLPPLHTHPLKQILNEETVQQYREVKTRSDKII